MNSEKIHAYLLERGWSKDIISTIKFDHLMIGPFLYKAEKYDKHPPQTAAEMSRFMKYQPKPEMIPVEENKQHKLNYYTKRLALLESKMESVSNLVQCGKCKGASKVEVGQKQTRSADEGSTIFCHCLNCNSHWKLS